MNVCDVCAGTIDPDCICGGTGTIDGLVTGLRREWRREKIAWQQERDDWTIRELKLQQNIAAHRAVFERQKSELATLTARNAELTRLLWEWLNRAICPAGDLMDRTERALAQENGASNENRK